MDMVLCAKTLGRRPGCLVMSIGAVMFDREGQDPAACLRAENQFYEPISAFDSSSHGFTSDPETLRWWKKQPSWSVVGADFMDSGTSVATACEKLAAFIAEHRPTKIWSNSPTFHVAIIDTLFDKMGLRSPIHYRDQMDFRTLMDLVYVDRDERPQIDGDDRFPSQHALGDGIVQARAIVQALRDMGPAPELLNQRWAMLDIETLGLKPGCGIMSIGAVNFGLDRQESLLEEANQFYVAINGFDMQNLGFRTDPETLRWWKKEPIWKDLSAEIRDSQIGVHRACTKLAHFLETARPDKVWANAPIFDIEMLRYTFKRMKLEFPVAYRQEMDFRTVMELAYPQRDMRPPPAFRDRFSSHHALGDSMEQALQTIQALRKLGIAPQPPALQERASRALRPWATSQP